ncbi:MAG TPA: YetF domain-containing protein [Blastocatellia bacterium]|nr:YetF domain-containing protein [Blastocatellia bacterium]
MISLLREQGVEDIKEVKKCFLESDGHISVIKKRPDDNDGKQPDKVTP